MVVAGRRKVHRVLHLARRRPHHRHPAALHRLGAAQLAHRHPAFSGHCCWCDDHRRRGPQHHLPGARNPPKRAARRLHQRGYARIENPGRLHPPVPCKPCKPATVDEAKRQEFYGIMLEDSDRLLATIEQVLRTGRIGAAAPQAEPHQRSISTAWSKSAWRARGRSTMFRPSRSTYRAGPRPSRSGRSGRSARRRLEPDRQRGQVFRQRGQRHRRDREPWTNKYVTVRVQDRGPASPKCELKQIFKRFYRVPGRLRPA